MSESTEKSTKLTDRFAIGVLSGVASLLTGALLWFIVFYFLSMANIEYEPSFMYVVVFGILGFISGFASMTSVVSSILGAVWRFLCQSLRIWV